MLKAVESFQSIDTMAIPLSWIHQNWIIFWLEVEELCTNFQVLATKNCILKEAQIYANTTVYLES